MPGSFLNFFASCFPANLLQTTNILCLPDSAKIALSGDLFTEALYRES